MNEFLTLNPVKLLAELCNCVINVNYFLLMSNKTINLANTNRSEHLLRTHTPSDKRWLEPPRTESISGSEVLDCTTLPIVVSLDPRALSSTLEWAHLLQRLRGRDCLSPRHDREWLCTWGRDGDVISRVPRIERVLLKADFCAVTQCHRCHRRRGLGGWDWGW